MAKPIKLVDRQKYNLLNFIVTVNVYGIQVTKTTKTNMSNRALSSSAEVLCIDGSGVKEITTKIQNIRSLSAREKNIQASTWTGSNVKDVYHPIL